MMISGTCTPQPLGTSTCHEPIGECRCMQRCEQAQGEGTHVPNLGWKARAGHRTTQRFTRVVES